MDKNKTLKNLLDYSKILTGVDATVVWSICSLPSLCYIPHVNHALFLTHPYRFVLQIRDGFMGLICCKKFGF